MTNLLAGEDDDDDDNNDDDGDDYGDYDGHLRLHHLHHHHHRHEKVVLRCGQTTQPFCSVVSSQVIIYHHLYHRGQIHTSQKNGRV